MQEWLMRNPTIRVIKIVFSQGVRKISPCPQRIYEKHREEKDFKRITFIKAKKKGDDWLSDRVYSGVPAGMFGREQEICVGYMSGASNVTYWLNEHGIEPNKELVDTILKAAKNEKHILSDEEILALVDAHSGTGG